MPLKFPPRVILHCTKSSPNQLFVPIGLSHTAYWTQSHHLQPTARLSLQVFDLIDWDVTASFMRSRPPGKRRWCTKHALEQCGVGKTLLFWKHQQDDECPRCQMPEDTTHVLQCHAPEALRNWSQQLIVFDTTLQNMATPDMLRKAILSRLQTWHSSTPFTDDPTWTSPLRDVIISQDSIGWKALLEGLPSKRWKQYMATLPHTRSPLRTSHSWTLKFLHALHLLAWSQWEHRNSTLHQLDRPRQRKAEELLNSLIVLELTTGPLSLPAPDHHYFHHPLGQLLYQSLPFRQAWYANVTSARLRHQRKNLIHDADNPTPDENILKWIRTGHY